MFQRWNDTIRVQACGTHVTIRWIFACHEKRKLFNTSQLVYLVQKQLLYIRGKCAIYGILFTGTSCNVVGGLMEQFLECVDFTLEIAFMSRINDINDRTFVSRARCNVRLFELCSIRIYARLMYKTRC